ncbi:ABC transporter permease [Alkalicoccus daliensis]|uniref:ABC-2 type transport system permease protein n=1 Tax=Alkalicoccus daliensis TaxID=745820 RepID=A0A1H0KF27_9BACI|nr:ABC transporter permease [Alkalicoccus daliensis]SDO54537.1 ABC-2 type transport system permease protein [Alkalicoccus daliensis]
MSFSIERMYAIFAKDLKDLSKNMFVLSTAVMPLFFALLFGRGDVVPLEIHFLVINLTFATVASFVQGALIAEEKEKNTLRGLMMSPANTAEILIGKSLVSAGLTVVTLILCIRMMNFSPAEPVILYGAMVLALIFFLLLGTMLGLLARTLIEASVIIIPIMFIFGMGNIFTGFFAEYEFLTVLEYLPNFQLEILAGELAAGGGWAEAAGAYLIIGAWAAASCILTVMIYRKKSFET